jgi:hypothetical protein
MPPADNTPNFDAMTPEEIMAWMESLAKRQGADVEQFTTAADIEIAEIDPDSVVIDEPGYVPSEGKFKGQKITGNIPTKSTPPSPPPAVEEPVPPAPVVEIPPPAEPEPIFEPVAQVNEPEPETAVGEGTMSWLESLAADQGVDFPDLSSLGAELAPAHSALPAANPVDWLESLAQNQGDDILTPTGAAAETAAAGDPMAWLESLAKRQGADEAELTTEANLDIPLPETWAEDGPGYTDYSFESPTYESKSSAPSPAVTQADPARELDPTGLEDPAAWLDSLASAQGFDAGIPQAAASETNTEQLSDDDISAALARGEVVPHDQMEAWMNKQLEIGSQREEPEELSAYDPDAPAVPADLPDWLLDQVGQAPPEEAPKQPVASEPPPLLDTIFEPPAVADMPDWLKEEPEAGELDSIFANTIEEDQAVIAPPPQEVIAPLPQAEAAPAAMDIDTNDPWVEAFDEEYEQGQADINQIPDWYARNVNDPQRQAAVERIANEPGAELQEANLQPETELPLGEPEPVPDWLQGVVSDDSEALEPAEIPDWLTQDVSIVSPIVTTDVVAAEPVGVQDWLQSIDVEATEIPDWLMDTLSTSTSEQPNIVTPAAVTAPITTQAVVPVPTQGISPVPVTAIDVAETLNNARSRANVNDIDSSLKSYESLIRANVELQAAVEDLGKLAEKFKTTPAVFRVLGDGLMRQGKLQAALDTYRKALNQL